jgi:hypothetical protein
VIVSRAGDSLAHALHAIAADRAAVAARAAEFGAVTADLGTVLRLAEAGQYEYLNQLGAQELASDVADAEHTRGQVRRRAVTRGDAV